MSDRKKQFEQGIKDYYGPKYDSDEDLEKEEQEQIKDEERYGSRKTAEKLRKDAWEKKGMYPKLKKSLKGAFYGDKRKKEEETEE